MHDSSDPSVAGVAEPDDIPPSGVDRGFFGRTLDRISNATTSVSGEFKGAVARLTGSKAAAPSVQMVDPAITHSSSPAGAPRGWAASSGRMAEEERGVEDGRVDSPTR
jgi:hypothetical protein